nr:hypothetical protein CTI12_AA475860 [Tanacetum cinerariifolium]
METVDSKQEDFRWTEMSYAQQLKRLTSNGRLLRSLTCCNVVINLVLFSICPFDPYYCGAGIEYLKGTSTELFYIEIDFGEETDNTEKKPAHVYIFKTDMTCINWEERECFKYWDISDIPVSDDPKDSDMISEILDNDDNRNLVMSCEVWKVMDDLKDAIFFMDVARDYTVSYSSVVASELGGGYIHIRGEMGKTIYSYNVKDDTISLSSIPSPMFPTSHVSMWECRVEDDHEEARCIVDYKEEMTNNNLIFLRSGTCTDNGVEFEDSHLLNIPFDLLEMIMELCVGVEYMNFRATCKQCLLAAPLIRWSNEASLRRLQTHSPVSPWLMVVDRIRGILTFTDPISGDNYFLKNSKVLIDENDRICYSRFGWLLFKMTPGSLVLFNPFTDDLRELPDSEHDLECLCFSAPPTSLDCMVVGFTTELVYFHFVNQKSTWRRVRLVTDPYTVCFPAFYGEALFLFCEQEVMVINNLGQKDYSGEAYKSEDLKSVCKSPTQYFITNCDEHRLLVGVGEYGEAVEVFADNESKQIWEKIDSVEPRNVRLGLVADGFNPFGKLSQAYIMWPVILTTYNLPPWLCMKESSFMLTLLIIGPKSPSKDIDVCLRPLIDDLKVLWALKGVETIDIATGQKWSRKGYKACPTCNEDTSSVRVLGKTTYVRHRRFLKKPHKWRKLFEFNGEIKDGDPPRKFDRDQIQAQLARLPMRVKEDLEGGPIRHRWMFPFKRFMKKLKGYVRNKAKLEGSIVEGYVAKEAFSFSSHYFRDATIKLNCPDRNVDPPSLTCQFQVFRSLCKSIGLQSVIRFDAQELKKVIWYVLHNSLEIDTYRSQFKNKFSNKDIKEEFLDWFGSQVNLDLFCVPNCKNNDIIFCIFYLILSSSYTRQRYVDNDLSVSTTSELFGLACGPTPTPISVNSCVVNGVRFVVHSRDERRTTQNRGICSPVGKDGEINEGRKVKHLVLRNNMTQILIKGEAFKDDQYILATQVKQCFYLEDMARRQPHWKVVENVNHKKFSDRGVIMVEEDPDVIHFDNSSNILLSTSFNDLDNATLHIDGQSTEVDALQDIIDLDEDDDIIDDEDALPYDLAYSNDEDLVNVDDDDGVDMSADVARDHDSDDGGDDRLPTHHIPTSCRGCFFNRGPVLIRFEWDDKKTLMPLGDHTSHWSNYLRELIREMPLYYPSWQKVLAEQKAAILTKIRIAFQNDLRNQDRAAQNHQNQAKSTVVCRQGSRSLARLRDQMMESSTSQDYPSLIHTFFVTYTVNEVFTRDEDRAIYEEMLRLQALGTNTPVLLRWARDVLITSPPPLTQCTHKSGDVEKLKKKNKYLTKQVNLMKKLFRSDEKFSQMLNQYESTPEFVMPAGVVGAGMMRWPAMRTATRMMRMAIFRDVIHGRHVARDYYPQRQCARESMVLSLEKVVNVDVIGMEIADPLAQPHVPL